MIRHIGIGALSGLVLFASFVTVVAIVAFCNERPVWAVSSGEVP